MKSGGINFNDFPENQVTKLTHAFFCSQQDFSFFGLNGGRLSAQAPPGNYAYAWRSDFNFNRTLDGRKNRSGGWRTNNTKENFYVHIITTFVNVNWAETRVEKRIHCGQLILGKISKFSCHQMSDFKAKMHQIRFPLGLRPRPRWGSLGYRVPPTPSCI